MVGHLFHEERTQTDASVPACECLFKGRKQADDGFTRDKNEGAASHGIGEQPWKLSPECF